MDSYFGNLVQKSGLRHANAFRPIVAIAFSITSKSPHVAALDFTDTPLVYWFTAHREKRALHPFEHGFVRYSARFASNGKTELGTKLMWRKPNDTNGTHFSQLEPRALLAATNMFTRETVTRLTPAAQ